jgi:hypothetical protein
VWNADEFGGQQRARLSLREAKRRRSLGSGAHFDRAWFVDWACFVDGAWFVDGACFVNGAWFVDRACFVAALLAMTRRHWFPE